MLEVIELSSWSEFENIIKKQIGKELDHIQSGPFFYRGQPDATWHLETTLERYFGPNFAVSSYYSEIKTIQHRIETFTDNNWDLPASFKYHNQLKSGENILNKTLIDYLQYLRHFGYPSPLLDWSYSPYVAAYFAFRELASKAKSIAIHEFFAVSELGENPYYIKSSKENTPAVICPIRGSSQRTKRHHLQQSAYTYCIKKINGRYCYVSHEDPDILPTEETERSGEWVVKYIIPASERLNALRSLEAYNINAYSLLGTEDSLLETLSLQTYRKRERLINIYGGTHPEDIARRRSG